MKLYDIASTGVVVLLMGMCGMAVVSEYNNKYAEIEEAGQMHAPCKDAFAAFFAAHPHCDTLSYEQGTGFVLMCHGRVGYIARELIEADGGVSSFIYDNTGNHEQGLCDCAKPSGPACEVLP